MKYLPVVLTVSILSGCIGTSMPRETALLSAKLGPELQEARRSHYAILDAWADAERDKVEILLHYNWTPDFIKNFLKQKIKEKGKEKTVKKIFLTEVCAKNVGEMDRALLLQDMLESLTNQIEKRRRKELVKIADLESSFRAALKAHHDQIGSMWNALNANVQSVQKGLEMEKHIRAAMERPIKKVIPLDKIRRGFDTLFKLGE